MVSEPLTITGKLYGTTMCAASSGGSQELVPVGGGEHVGAAWQAQQLLGQAGPGFAAMRGDGSSRDLRPHTGNDRDPALRVERVGGDQDLSC